VRACIPASIFRLNHFFEFYRFEFHRYFFALGEQQQQRHHHHDHRVDNADSSSSSSRSGNTASDAALLAQCSWAWLARRALLRHAGLLLGAACLGAALQAPSAVGGVLLAGALISALPRGMYLGCCGGGAGSSGRPARAAAEATRGCGVRAPPVCVAALRLLAPLWLVASYALQVPWLRGLLLAAVPPVAPWMMLWAGLPVVGMDVAAAEVAGLSLECLLRWRALLLVALALHDQAWRCALHIYLRTNTHAHMHTQMGILPGTLSHVIFLFTLSLSFSHKKKKFSIFVYMAAHFALFLHAHTCPAFTRQFVPLLPLLHTAAHHRWQQKLPPQVTAAAEPGWPCPLLWPPVQPSVEPTTAAAAAVISGCAPVARAGACRPGSRSGLSSSAQVHTDGADNEGGAWVEDLEPVLRKAEELVTPLGALAGRVR
jgi:hypothetical protein